MQYIIKDVSNEANVNESKKNEKQDVENKNDCTNINRIVDNEGQTKGLDEFNIDNVKANKISNKYEIDDKLGNTEFNEINKISDRFDKLNSDNIKTGNTESNEINKISDGIDKLNINDNKIGNTESDASNKISDGIDRLNINDKKPGKTESDVINKISDGIDRLKSDEHDRLYDEITVQYKPHSVQACLKAIKKKNEMHETITAFNLLPFIIEKTTKRMLKRVTKNLINVVLMFDDEAIDNLQEMKIKILTVAIIQDFENIYEFLIDNYLVTNGLLYKILVVEAFNLSLQKLTQKNKEDLFYAFEKIVAYKLCSFENKIIKNNVKCLILNLVIACKNGRICEIGNKVIENM